MVLGFLFAFVVIFLLFRRAFFHIRLRWFWWFGSYFMSAIFWFNWLEDHFLMINRGDILFLFYSNSREFSFSDFKICKVLWNRIVNIRFVSWSGPASPVINLEHIIHKCHPHVKRQRCIVGISLAWNQSMSSIFKLSNTIFKILSITLWNIKEWT